MAKNKETIEKASEENKSMGREILDLVIYVAVVALIVYLILHFVGQRTVVNGDSMDNTLKDGQSLIMDKISYRFHDPERFDIVIFPGPEENGENPYFIKRVIGLPGETVQILDGKVYIDGEQLQEDVYGITDTIDYPGIAEEPLTMGDDEYFCMGDNRVGSVDSRRNEVGVVPAESIKGKVVIRLFPFNKIKRF